MDYRTFIPHGFCLAWDPGLVWLQAGSDVLIALAYYSIPAVLLLFLHRRRDLVFRPIFALFAAFILACGTTHVFGVITLFAPLYWTDGIIKAVTAALSVATALVLWPLLPKALALPSPDALRALNDQLAEEIRERDRTAILLRESEEKLRHAQKMEAIGQLTGGIAHDFNNLLTVIMASLEVLDQNGKLDPRAQRMAGNALEGARRAARLTSQLLSFSRRSRLAPQSLDPRGVVDGIAELLAQSVGAGIRLRIGEEGHAAPVWPIMADRAQFEVALLNLVINARDAVTARAGREAAGEIVIGFADCPVGPEAAAAMSADPIVAGDYVEVSVSDNGTGMTADVLGRALEPFFTTKPVGAGTGLGLSQTYGFAVQSGGTLRLSSTAGAGTRASILLPRAAAADRQAAAPAARPPSLARGEVIVLAEDDVLLRHTASEVLRTQGYVVETAPDARAALALLQTLPRVDLLLTDVMMPGGMNGVELARAARALSAKLRVMFATGYSEREVLAQWPERLDVVSKPFSLDELCGRVTARLQETQAAETAA